MPTLDLNYKPKIFVDTSGLTREQWLEYRRKGLGGSDAAAVLGISPFRTARDLYWDKLNVVSDDEAGNWVALEVGNLLEPLVAKIFEHKTGLKVYQRKCMFQHPQYPWMLADLDYLVELPDGSIAILEIKTTNYHAKDHWWYNGKEIVPVYYEAQGRHYMATMNIDRVYYCCLYGNNEDEAIIRHIDRDPAYEQELIFLEDSFWNKNVLAHNPPPYTEDGDLILESVRRQFGPADIEAPAVVLDKMLGQKILLYLQLKERKKLVDAEAKEYEAKLKQMKGLIVAEMGRSCTAVYDGPEESYTVTYNPSRTESIPKANLERLKEVYPEIYEKYVVVTESRKFYVKKAAQTTAA